MSKAAIVAHTPVFANELGPNVRVNCISPGLILGTLIFRNIIISESALQLFFDGIVRRNALLRPGVPLDVAKIVAFLASPLAAWMSGKNIIIDGGFT